MSAWRAALPSSLGSRSSAETRALVPTLCFTMLSENVTEVSGATTE